MSDAQAATLLPAENMALTVARAQAKRGENPEANVTTVLVMALDRLTGREDWTALDTGQAKAAEGVHEVGRLRDVDGEELVISTYDDHLVIEDDQVCLMQLDAAGRDQFARLYFEAERQAEAWASQHAETEEPAGPVS